MLSTIFGCVDSGLEIEMSKEGSFLFQLGDFIFQVSCSMLAAMGASLSHSVPGYSFCTLMEEAMMPFGFCFFKRK